MKGTTIRADKRFVYGVPKVDNANYLGIQVFLSALNEELERLNTEAHELEEKITENVIKILEGRPDE